MAVNKPVGDNARKGAVNKRSQTKTERRDRLGQAQQGVRRVHGAEAAAKKRGRGQKIQGRTAGEGRTLTEVF
jgi:hypothetical protein